jgi:DNA-binding transcriptional LysR family regulator
MRMKIDTGDIEAFAAVGNALSFTVAAELLNISPSALSRRISKLESQLDSRLLDRTTREVKLTLAGKQFLDRSQEILTNVDELVTAIRGERAPRASAVTVASIPSIASSALPDVMRTFSERNPHARLKIKDMTTNDVLDAVQAGEADFGITSYCAIDVSLEFVPVVRANYVLIMPRDHVLANRQSISWAEINQHRVISTWKSSGVRMVMDVELAKLGRRISWFYEVQQMYTVLALVERGLGIAPVPSFFVSNRDLRDMAAVPLVDPILWVDLGLVRSRDRPLRQHAAAFWDLIIEHLRRTSKTTGIGQAVPTLIGTQTV